MGSHKLLLILSIYPRYLKVSNEKFLPSLIGFTQLPLIKSDSSISGYLSIKVTYLFKESKCHLNVNLPTLLSVNEGGELIALQTLIN